MVIGGSRAMPGAAALAAFSALRSGAGLVKVAAPVSAVASVAAYSPCYTFLPCPETSEGTLGKAAVPEILGESENADVLALGPGISIESETAGAVIEIVRMTELPLVIDADGLNILAEDPDAVKGRNGVTVLTPHPGEFERLDGAKPPRDDEGRLEAAKRLAEKTGCVVLLKGKGTVVTDGSEVHVIGTGNPGMATAGSGDVLTGVIAALFGQLEPGAAASALAAHLHGLAGDLAAAKVGEVSLTASDIVDHLPAAFIEYQGS
jgi:NAD(P)H-hydrate epimerase